MRSLIYEEKWDNCLQVIKKCLPAERVKAWFSPIVPLKFERNVLTVQVPSQFFYEWIEDNYLDVLRKSIHEVLGAKGKLVYSIVSEPPDGHPTKPSPVPPKKAPAPSDTGESSSFLWASLCAGMDDRYVFDTFVEGKSNRLASSVGYSLAEHMGKSVFNPLMIYGGVGLGKTHLLQAIGHRMREKKPSTRVAYLSAEQFITQFVRALQQKKMQDFHHFYADVDALLVDDIQFFKQKEKTQEIFFHIFNTLHQRGKQLVLTCDTSPRELEGVHERLLSRFKWGVTSYLAIPDYPMRQKIIIQKAKDASVHMPEEVTAYLADTVTTNIRDLEGVLTSLVAHATFTRRPIDTTLAKETVAQLVRVVEKKITMPHIQEAVSDYFQVPSQELCAKSRRREIVRARNIAMYLSKSHTPHSLKVIGHFYGRRDHTTVIHAMRSVERMAHQNAGFRNTLTVIQEKIKRHMEIRHALKETVSVS